MNRLLISALFLIVTTNPTASFADKVCLKSTVKKNVVTHTRKKITSGRCPRGYTELVDTSTLVGPTGATGAAGTDGAIRVYGNGGDGALTIASSIPMDNILGQYTDITINSGITLTVPYGTTIRCTGTFTNNGSITVSPKLNGALYGAAANNIYTASFSQADQGFSDGAPLFPPYGTGAMSGGFYGLGMSLESQKNLMRGMFVSAAGGATGVGGVGGSGGGVLRILCKTAIVNATGGNINALGGDGSGPCAGGGGGGYILLASAGSVTNDGSVIVSGGAGSPGNTQCAGGGGGGGGIIHYLAPVVLSNGTNTMAAGAGTASAGAGSVTSVNRSGGGGGGGSGGNGGSGGGVIVDGSTSAGQPGDVGKFFSASMDPTAHLF